MVGASTGGLERGRRDAVGGALAVLATAAAVALFPGSASASISADFDGDDREDLAIGAPDESVQGDYSAGAVHVLYGAAGGLSTGNDQLLAQDLAGLAGVSEPADQFGSALAAGDFDDDGFADLAIGAQGENNGGQADNAGIGVVHVLFGTPGGLTLAGDQLWGQSTAGILGGPELFDEFGESLIAGDFDGDKGDDLAIGVPGEALGLGGETVHGAGVVQVLYSGGSAGLTASGDQLIRQDELPGGEIPRLHERFGRTLAAASFDADSRDDLVIGVPFEALGTEFGSHGIVHVVYGTVGGLFKPSGQIFSQATPGIAGSPEEWDQFGSSLAIGRFDEGTTYDLAVGAPSEGLATVSDDAEGQVHVIYGSRGGLTSADDQAFTQNTLGMAGDGAEASDVFGEALASGQFDGTGRHDLAIDVAGEEVPGQEETGPGAVTVMFGADSGLGTSSSQFLHQDLAGMPGDGAQQEDRWGSSLAAGNFDTAFARGFRDDLVVGAPRESLEGTSTTIDLAGAVTVLYGTAAGISTAGGLWLTQETPGLLSDGAEESDGFGSRVASGIP